MKRINKVAILGAGTMGARIAAQFANAGVPSYLLDIVPPDAEGSARNKIAAAGLEAAKKSKPAAFMEPSLARLVTIGNFEDDDHDLRCRQAGYSLWQADSAFLHHVGSSTFNELGIDYSMNIERNLRLILEKWQSDSFEGMWDQAVEGRNVYIPLTAATQESGVTIKINGTTTIDDEFAKMPAEGIIAFQLHAGKPMEVTFKDIQFTDLSGKK